MPQSMPKVLGGTGAAMGIGRGAPVKSAKQQQPVKQNYIPGEMCTKMWTIELEAYVLYDFTVCYLT